MTLTHRETECHQMAQAHDAVRKVYKWSKWKKQKHLSRFHM